MQKAGQDGVHKDPLELFQQGTFRAWKECFQGLDEKQKQCYLEKRIVYLFRYIYNFYYLCNRNYNKKLALT